MATATTMPAVNECTVSACAYNSGGCHAFAITVTAAAGSASCGTFVPLDGKGGLPTASAQVGACSRTDCAHNADLECTADAVRVGMSGDLASCLTYTPA